MTHWYAFSCRADRTEAAANRLGDYMDCDAFAVMQTPSKRLPRHNVRVPGEPVCVLPTYVFAGFERPPNFFRIERGNERTKYKVWPVPFNGQIKPLNRMNISWITGELPAPLHRHYDDPPPIGVERFKVGDLVKCLHGERRVKEINGTQLRLDLAMLGAQLEIDADDAELVVSRVA